MGLLGLIEPQRPPNGLQHAVGHTGEVAPFEPV